MFCAIIIFICCTAYVEIFHGILVSVESYEPFLHMKERWFTIFCYSHLFSWEVILWLSWAEYFYDEKLHNYVNIDILSTVRFSHDNFHELTYAREKTEN